MPPSQNDDDDERSHSFSDPDGDAMETSQSGMVEPHVAAAAAHSESPRSSAPAGRRGIVGNDDVIVVITNTPMPRETSRGRAPSSTAADRNSSDASTASPGATAGPPPPQPVNTDLPVVTEGTVFTPELATYAEFVSAAPVMGIPMATEVHPPRAAADDDHHVLPPHFSTAFVIAGPDGAGDPGIIRHMMHFRAAAAADDEAAAESEEALTVAWALTRTVRLWSVMDFVIVCVWVMLRIWFAALCVFPIIGYAGARRYMPRLLVIYGFALLAMMPLRGYVGYLGGQDADKESVAAVYYALTGVGILMELWLLYKLWAAYRAMARLPEEHRAVLRTGWMPDEVAVQ